MDDTRRGRLLFCKRCNACQATDSHGNPRPCEDCGGLYFVLPSLAPYRLTERDRKFLRHLRIESTPAAPPPFERSQS